MEFENIAVIGAGTMGAGIAQLAASYGSSVRLIDVSADMLRTSVDGIRARLDRSVDKGKRTADQRDAIMGRITTSQTITDLANIQLAIEAVVENPQVKETVFRELDAATPSGAVLATNTSSLRVSEIAIASTRPERVVGMHFFNPAPVMPLVEIIAGDASDAWAVDVAFRAAEAWGKVPVRAKDTPGFIVNRVARGYYLEALRMLGEGVADVETIDGAMRTLGGFRMGPFQLMDLVGLDINYAVSSSVYEQSGRPARLVPHEIQRSLVDKGLTGRKAGRGFYRYDVDPPEVDLLRDERPLKVSCDLTAVVDRFAQSAALHGGATLDGRNFRERYVFARILAAIMNEASMTLADGVATGSDIDTAMRHGTNYPKGPLEWADGVGLEIVGDLLRALDEISADGRFRPARRFGG